MPNIIPNWTEVTGEVVAIEKDAVDSAFSCITLKVFDKKPFKNFPDLVKTMDSDHVRIFVADSMIREKNIKNGVVLTGLVKVVSPGKYYFNSETLKVI